MREMCSCTRAAPGRGGNRRASSATNLHRWARWGSSDRVVCHARAVSCCGVLGMRGACSREGHGVGALSGWCAGGGCDRVDAGGVPCIPFPSTVPSCLSFSSAAWFVSSTVVQRRGSLWSSLGWGALSACLLAWLSASMWSILTHFGEGGHGAGLAYSRGGGKVVGETGSALQTCVLTAQAPVSRRPRCAAVAQRRGRSCWKSVRRYTSGHQRLYQKPPLTHETHCRSSGLLVFGTLVVHF